MLLFNKNQDINLMLTLIIILTSNKIKYKNKNNQKITNRIDNNQIIQLIKD